MNMLAILLPRVLIIIVLQSLTLIIKNNYVHKLTFYRINILIIQFWYISIDFYFLCCFIICQFACTNTVGPTIVGGREITCLENVIT